MHSIQTNNAAGVLNFYENSAVRMFTASYSAQEAVIFLHGFPADSGKNEDIAERLTNKFNMDSFVFHFRGLGESQGLFSFQDCLRDASKFTREIESRPNYKKIHLIAHSWGGLVGLNLVREFPETFSKIILLAPLCLLPEDNEARTMLADFIESRADVSLKYSVDFLLEDLAIIRQDFNCLKVAADITDLSHQIALIQGSQDEVCEPKGCINLCETLGSNAFLIEIEDDHWFRNRDRLFNIITKEFEKGRIS